MGKFTPGTPKPENSGRKKGSPNKRTTQIREYAESRGVSPAHFCIDLLAGDTDAIGKESITFEDKQWAVELLMPYLEAKRKPVDSDGNDSNDFISDILNALNDK